MVVKVVIDKPKRGEKDEKEKKKIVAPPVSF